MIYKLFEKKKQHISRVLKYLVIRSLQYFNETRMKNQQNIHNKTIAKFTRATITIVRKRFIAYSFVLNYLISKKNNNAKMTIESVSSE